MGRYVLIVCLSILSISKASAQKIDLDKLLEENTNKNKKVQKFVEGTFNTSHIIQSHSIEGTQKGILDFRILHRFGTLNKGLYEFFGLDNASMRIGFDYGISDRLSVGVGRSTYQKQYDAFIKYAILRQTLNNKMPISLSYLGSSMVQTLKDNDPSVKKNFSDRLFFAHQFILARKMSKGFSLQLMPTLVHYNLVPVTANPNDLYSLGVASRIRVSPTVSINSEYYYQINKLPNTYNSLSVGVDIETAGHVFQLHVTNSTGMTERSYITGTTGTWGNGDILFGFNISRKFELKKRKK
jgi:hypothetical protein